MSTKRYCYSCDLKDDSKLIAEYKEYHAKGNAWPEITKSIKNSGIVDMEIYLTNQSETQKDELYETQDYSQFRKIVHDIVNSKHFQLLEILTNKIHLEIIQNEFVIGAKIKITKPDIFSDCEVAYELSNI